MPQLPAPLEQKPVWTSGDAVNLGGFLSTPTGQRLFSRLMYLRPEYNTFTSVEERAIKSALIEGYELALTEIQKAVRDHDGL